MLTPLPIDPLLSDIVQTVRDHGQVILTATPGAGKTTRLPPELLNTVKGKIAVLEPRRMATVAACQRVADERGWKVGEEVGYQVRFESRVSKNTRLVFMTDALLLRRLSDDPELKEFDLVVIDEFHERNLNQDLILGVLKELQELGRDLKIMIMSATLDVSRLQQFLPESQHIDVPGKVFPLEVRHINQPLRQIPDNEFYERVVDAVVSSARETKGDILVFLPGVGEITRTQERLEEKNLGRDIIPLHGSLSLNEQKNVLREHDKPRVVLATNIAEASVTVPGVDRVIDTGLARVVETNLQSGFSRLDLTRIAHFNARQRAGRAARQKEGVCLRLWTPHEEVTQIQEMPPECQRAELSSSLLLLAHLGVSDFFSFAWFDRPPGALLNMAVRALKDVGALDEKSHLTETGKKLLRFPLPPRWGALLLLSEKFGGRKLAARAAALLQDRDIVHGKSEAHSYLECDVTYRLQLLGDVERGRASGVNQRQAQTVLEAAEQLERLVSSEGKGKDDLLLKRLLLLSQSDRLCRRRGDSERGVMVGGRGVRLDKESQVRASEFFLALNGVDLPNQPDTRISIASGLEKSFVLEVLKDRITVFDDVFFDEAKGQFYSRRVRRFRDLDLDDPVLTKINPDELGERFTEVLVQRWNWLVEQNENLSAWMRRWKFFIQAEPAMAENLKPEQIRQALEMAAFGKNRVDDVTKQDLVGFLEQTMDKNIVRQFQKEVPARFEAPSGHTHAIQYLETEAPFVEVRLQEMFGLTATPKLAFSKVPLTFKLLAPNFRPVQVTSDIAGFWQRAYVEVRKELRGRYPKHPWPDDPLTAPPVAKGRRRQ